MNEDNYLNSVEPIDDYVRQLLKTAKHEYNLEIDLENPTRGQRLEAAVAMKDKGGGYSSIELMVGRRVDTREDALKFMLLMQALHPIDPRTFFNGFSHDYFPKNC